MARPVAGVEKIPSIKKSIRYPQDVLEDYVKIAKVSGVPKDALVVRAMRAHLGPLKKKYPDYKFITLQNHGKDERI